MQHILDIIKYHRISRVTTWLTLLAVVLVSTVFAQAVPGEATSHTVVTLINQVGLPIGLLLLILMFAGRYVWPFMMKQIEAAQSARDIAQKEFIESLRRLEDQVAKNLDKIAEKLNVIHEDIRTRK